jgi:adenylate kinase
VNIVILGAPGSGKGTQADFIKDLFGIPHISTGDLLRARQETDPALREILSSGGYCSDEMMIEIIKDRLKEPNAKKGWILDGFPRTVLQADALQKIINGKLTVLYISINQKEIETRLSNRRMCSKCNAIFHLINHPPKTPNICDSCSGTIIQRSDDTPEVIRNRLHIYNEKTSPLIEYYKKQGILIEIDSSGGKTPKEIFEKIKSILIS